MPTLKTEPPCTPRPRPISPLRSPDAPLDSVRTGITVSVRRRGRGRFGDHRRHFAFDAVRRDDDRVRQTFRPAPVLAEDLVGFLAAGALRGHLLELLLQLRDRQPAALEPVARLDDLFDVEREDIAPALLALGP